MQAVGLYLYTDSPQLVTVHSYDGLPQVHLTTQIQSSDRSHDHILDTKQLAPIYGRIRL